MTIGDITPNPSASAADQPAVFMTPDQINELANMQRENQAAHLRGEPLPHVVTPEMLRLAVASIRRNRGTMELAGKSSTTKATGKAKVTKIDANELDLDGL